MKIKNIIVNSFGKLNKKEINLDDGINILYGKNESGKSTLLEFIVDMFYNISREKAKKAIPDSEKFKPWNTEEYSGKLGYKLDNGREYEIFRNFNKKTDVQLYDENKEEVSKTFNIDKKIGSTFFMDQTNLDKKAFLSSVVSKQEEVKLNEESQKDIIQKIINLASTGDDNISYDKVKTELQRRAKEEVGSKDTRIQPINIIENKIRELVKEKEELEQYKDIKYELEKADNEIKENINDAVIYNDFVQDVKIYKDNCNIYNNRIKEYMELYKDNQREQVASEELKNKVITKIEEQKRLIEIENKQLDFLNEYKKIVESENKDKEKSFILKEQQKEIYHKIDSLEMSKNTLLEEKEKKKSIINELEEDVNKDKLYIGILLIILGVILFGISFVVSVLKIVGILTFVTGTILFILEKNKIKAQEKNKINVKEQLLKIDEEYEMSIAKLEMEIKLHENRINEIESDVEKINQSNLKQNSKEKEELINKAYMEIDKGLVDYYLAKENIQLELEKLIKENNENKLENNKNELLNEETIKKIEKCIKNKEELKLKIKELSNKIDMGKNEIVIKYQDKIEKDKLYKVLELDNIQEYAIQVKNDLDDMKLKSKEVQLDKDNILPKLENLVNVEEKLENLEVKREELLDYRKCIELAIESLDKAYIKMKNSVTPQFSKELSTNISKITNNKYKNVRINEQDGLTVELENGRYDSANKLSCGTIEQLYLSLRIAILNQITEENMPIILDEAFAYYDDDRLENILKYINEEYSNKQVLIFSCSNREIELLEKNNIKFNLVNI